MSTTAVLSQTTADRFEPAKTNLICDQLTKLGNSMLSKNTKPQHFVVIRMALALSYRAQDEVWPCPIASPFML